MRKAFIAAALSLAIIAVVVVGFSYGRGVLAEFTSWGSPDAKVPGLIPFQGVLTYSSSNGVHVEDGSYDVTFALYTVATGGTAVWTETQSVTTVSGVFSTHLGTTTPITPAAVASDELWLGMTFTEWTYGEMTPRQRIGSAIYALVAQEVANPKHPTFYLSHDGIRGQDMTCSTPASSLILWGSGFQANESVVFTAMGVGANSSDVNILSVTADSNGAFMAQGSSSSAAIACSSSGSVTVMARGDKGSLSSQPVLISTTPTPGPSPTPTPVGALSVVSSNHPTIILSHDGILQQSITCSTPRNSLIVCGGQAFSQAKQ